MNTQTKVNDYEQQALDFLAATGTELLIEYQYTGKHFPDDKENRDVYRFTLKNDKGEYSGNFGDSLHNTQRNWYIKNPRFEDIQERRKVQNLGLKVTAQGRYFRVSPGQKPTKPSAYDILACLITYHPGTFEDFCADYGYNEAPLSDYPKVMGIYSAVLNEYSGLSRIFSPEEMEKLGEIN